MFVTGESGDLVGQHRGYVAGRYRDGYRSDHWTDVTRCAQHTFISYLAVCTCGWTGPDRQCTDEDYRCCLQDWEARHSGAEVLSPVGRPTAADATATASSHALGVDVLRGRTSITRRVDEAADSAGVRSSQLRSSELLR
jgi:hypothetical protein